MARILTPIVSTLDKLESLDDPEVTDYVQKEYGGVEQCRKDILCKEKMMIKNKHKPFFLDDFFRHGFDGSGADNYFDAGSCIDGRLTSAWNCKDSFK